MAKAFSAPGKALLAGGYLVLDSAYDAYVTALSSRMHAVIEPDKDTSHDYSTLRVLSPQFKDGEWQYEFQNDQVKEINAKVNPFLEATIKTVLSYAHPQAQFNLKVTIFSDPGYHSQSSAAKRASSNGRKTFLYHELPINDVPKTGLGSSAGLVSVVTAALMSYFEPGSETSVDRLHNLAQIGHCLAQKKIGSGFDVAAAIYGSIKYRRFQPSVVNDVLAVLENDPSRFPQAVGAVVDADWDFKHEKCSLPSELQLLMGDIEGGSETPKMVSKVLQWRKENPDESGQVYRQLNDANNKFMDALEKLNQTHSEDAMLNLSESLQEIRRGLKLMTDKAQVPIEPPIQTELLDNVGKLDGCLGGLVPGAGGFDAIAVLAISSKVDDVKQATAREQEKYNNVHWVDLHEEADGLKVENIKDYAGLV
ncbi:ERG8 [Candida theae]|uniref:Phosphomevalonate kinase n=1 Tax=Candida theae TaxID=1198502 RepID=A0AAD5BBD9_9ASCO|nr:ERG8 [Candida theae]KAI5949208.1 ERG8 [Candida theae]